MVRPDFESHHKMKGRSVVKTIFVLFAVFVSFDTQVSTLINLATSLANVAASREKEGSHVARALLWPFRTGQ